MLVRLVFLVAASVAAYAVKQVSLGRQKELKPPEGSHEARYEKNEHEDNDKDGNTQLEDKEEEIEQVKRISTVISPNSRSPTGVDDDEMGLPEFEELLSSVMDLPSPKDKFDVRETHQPGEYQRVYGREMENHAMEMERLQNLVKELEEREVKLEGELLEYYGLKEQEVNIAELQKQLKIKMVEIDMLNVNISTLQTEKKKLEEEIERGSSSKKELEAARKKIKELQRQMQLDANQTKGHLLMLKQQVTSLKSKEEDATKRDVELERKLRVLKDVDVEMAELKRKNRELQHEKREISMRLDAAEAKVAILENMTETDMVAKVRDEVNGLMHANEDLLKQVEGLQTNRFSEVEELVYLRWVNACLRYELRNFQAPVGKASARDLNKSLSPKSQERAKRLLLDYAVSDVASQQGQGDTDLESISSLPSSPGSEDFDTVSIDSSSSRYSSSKKPSLLQKLKRWGKSKDDSSVSSPSRSFGESSPRPSIGHRVSSSKGPLEALMMRNSGETVAITTYGRKENDHDDLVSSPDLPPIRTTVPSGEPLNNVAASFHLMSKSVDGVLDDKYPAYKDRHKLSLAREKAIRDKADQARAERFGDNSKVESKPKLEKPTNGSPSPIIHKERVRSDAKGDIAVDDSNEKPNENRIDSLVVNKIKLANIEKKAPRVARPPPRPSSASSGSKTSAATVVSGGGPPPPPPPPGAPPPPPPLPGSISRGAAGSDKVHRAPELVELYQSLMKREAKKDTSSLSLGGSNSGDARNNMIGEIEGRSAFLIAVKADVETQGDFVQTLASEVRAASFTNVDDLVSFVNWLDEELSFLVDERAVLKHFDWPEGKADALREASFEYQDLMKLEKQMSCFVDDSKLPCEAALKKMYSLLEKVEQSVYALLRTRDMAISRYKEFGLPYDWMLDSGVVGKIKLASVQLARKYMKRVATELDSLGGPEKEPTREFLVLQGVRFAFRVHQFAGGFDAESMKAFEELRSRVHSQKSEAVDTSSTA